MRSNQPSRRRCAFPQPNRPEPLRSRPRVLSGPRRVLTRASGDGATHRAPHDWALGRFSEATIVSGGLKTPRSLDPRALPLKGITASGVDDGSPDAAGLHTAVRERRDIRLRQAGRAKTVLRGDSGASITLKRGEGFDVTLVDNPSTGYAWEIDPESDVAQLIELQGEPVYRPGLSVPGASGTVTFTFRAIADGSGLLKLRFWRSFEPAVPPLRTFEVNITVQPE